MVAVHGVDDRVNAEGVVIPPFLGEGGKMNRVCVAAGVADVDMDPVDFPDAFEEMLEKAFLIGNGTKEESLEERRDLAETLDAVLGTDEDEDAKLEAVDVRGG